MSKHYFKKGDKVTLMGEWNEDGGFYYRHGIVMSAGKKQAHIVDANSGECLGRNFEPYAHVPGPLSEMGYCSTGIQPGHIEADEVEPIANDYLEYRKECAVKMVERRRGGEFFTEAWAEAVLSKYHNLELIKK